ncbi:hypothetical protein H5T87_03130 [bacterium]|nr:hypothetical protein [bacterium]
MSRRKTTFLVILGLIILLFLISWYSFNKKVYLTLPDITFNQSTLGEALLRVSTFWGKGLPSKELTKIGGLSFKFSDIVEICRNNSLLCLFIFADVGLIKKLLQSNFPVIICWEEEAIAPGWGSLVYNYHWDFIINGYDNIRRLNLLLNKLTIRFSFRQAQFIIIINAFLCIVNIIC